MDVRATAPARGSSPGRHKVVEPPMLRHLTNPTESARSRARCAQCRQSHPRGGGHISDPVVPLLRAAKRLLGADEVPLMLPQESQVERTMGIASLGRPFICRGRGAELAMLLERYAQVAGGPAMAALIGAAKCGYRG